MITRSVTLHCLNDTNTLKTDPNIDIQMWKQEKSNSKTKSDRKRRLDSENQDNHNNTKKSKLNRESTDTDDEKNEKDKKGTSYTGDILQIFLPADDLCATSEHEQEEDIVSKNGTTDMNASSMPDGTSAVKTAKAGVVDPNIQVDRNNLTKHRVHRNTRSTGAKNQVLIRSATAVASTSADRNSKAANVDTKFNGNKKLCQITDKNTRHLQTVTKSNTDRQSSYLIKKNNVKVNKNNGHKERRNVNDQTSVKIEKKVCQDHLNEYPTNNRSQNNNDRNNNCWANHERNSTECLTNIDNNSNNTVSTTSQCQPLYRNPYLNFYVPLFSSNKCRHLPASHVAKYAGAKWNAMKHTEKQKYRDMAARAVKQRRPLKKLAGVMGRKIQTRSGRGKQRDVNRERGG